MPDVRSRALRPLAALTVWACLAGPSSALEPVEVNLASQAELEQLPGIGVVLGEQLLAQRRSRPFDDWSDLLRRVPGLGPRQAVRLSAAGLRVQGTAYAAP